MSGAGETLRPPAARRLRGEFGPMLRLSAPLALAELGWMAMGTVDTVMAGPLGPAALGAGALGAMLFYPLVIAGSGVLLGMDTLVAQAYGAGDRLECRRSLVDGLWLALALFPLLAGAILVTEPLLVWGGANPHVLAYYVPFMRALIWGVPPLLVYTVLRRYLQAIDIVRPITFALVSANLVNLAGNYALMYGHWGFPRLGLTGSGYATSISRVYMAAVLVVAVAWHERKTGRLLRQLDWAPKLSRLRALAVLGAPAAGQMLAEGAVFGFISVFAAKLDEVQMAAHGIALNVISVVFMVPLGISSAAAVRVGQAVGRKDPEGAAAAGWCAMALSGLLVGSACVALWAAPGFIAGLFSREAGVLACTVALLRISALFELFDGFQVVATGALRGLGDTRTPLLFHLGGYWGLGLPAAYLLCFQAHLGARGLWVGLCVALVAIGVALTAAWRRRISQVSAAHANAKFIK